MNLRSELGQYNPHMRAVAAINVESDMMAVTRANGVLSALSAPNGGVISGQAALINTAGWTSEDIAVLPAAAMVLNYPRAASSAAAALAAYREQVRRLESELRTASQYDARRRTGLDEIRTVYEAMRPMMRGELPVFVTADTEDQIRGALAMSDSFGLKLIIYGGREAWRVRDLLARRQVPVVLASMQRIPGADQTYDAIFTAPGVLVAAGVKIAFSTGTAASSRHLPFHASLAVAYGLSKEDAMKALTIWPAEIFGASTRIGSIEVGKMANLFIATGDPLDIRSQVVDLFIKGRRVPMDDRQSRLYEKYKERPSAGRK
jgi:imidazolonepropionase-like amidohydrolase